MLKTFFLVFVFIVGIIGYSFYDYMHFPSSFSNINFAGEKIPEQQREFFTKEYLSLASMHNVVIFYKNNYKIKYIKSQLEKNNLPDDIKYLPIIESKLQNTIESHKGAMGVWQFIPETAEDYGLKIDKNIDERKNLEKSTQAAIKYLKNIQKRFNNWTLSIAAYNRGENAIANALKNQQKNNFYELTLNTETQKYIYKIIALKYAQLWLEEKIKLYKHFFNIK